MLPFAALTPRPNNWQALDLARNFRVTVAPGVSIPLSDLRGATYIIGQQGMGKTTLLARFILQVINSGFGAFMVVPKVKTVCGQK